MSTQIWAYQGMWRDKAWLKEANSRSTCLYCPGVKLTKLPYDFDALSGHKPLATAPQRWITMEGGATYYCGQCGWWTASCMYFEEVMGEGYRGLRKGAGMLYEFAGAENKDAIDESRRALLRDFDSSSKEIAPWRLEAVVASIFRDFGYVARVTAYTGDGGIDIVLDKEDLTVGVQVKRYRRSVKVEHIRAFAGALVLKGMPGGVFVTTSDFQKGCRVAASAYKYRGIKVELVNGRRLYEALEIPLRPKYETWSDIVADPVLQLVATGGGQLF